MFDFIINFLSSCQLLDATCDHTGFTITFNKVCAATDYKAIQWNELYTNGFVQQDSTINYFGEAADYNPECLFRKVYHIQL